MARSLTFVLCERNFSYTMCECVSEWLNVCGMGGGGSNVNSENTFVCLPLCDCVNQGI